MYNNNELIIVYSGIYMKFKIIFNTLSLQLFYQLKKIVIFISCITHWTLVMGRNPFL